MPPSLRLRLALALTIAIILVAIGAGAAAFYTILDETHDEQDSLLSQTASLIDPYNPLPLYDGDDSNYIDIQPVSPFGRYGHFFRQNPADGFHDIGRRGERYRVYIHTYPDGYRLAFIQDSTYRDQAAYAGARHVITPLLLLVPLLIVVSLITVHRALRPVRRLSHQLAARDERDLSPLADAHIPSEISGFIHAINHLLTRIDAALKREQRFIADAAHELRTPMTALTLQAERLAAQMDNDAARRELEPLRSGIRRSSALLEQLLTLARSQHRDDAPASCHVQAVYRQVVETLLPLAEAADCDLGISDSTDAELPLPATELYTLIKNLADNAIRHGGQCIDLGIAVNGRTTTLSVEDDGDGIPAAERERVLDPFYRRLENSGDGTGLGLAIVKSLCDKHGAQLSLHDAHHSKNGLRVEIQFTPR